MKKQKIKNRKISFFLLSIFIIFTIIISTKILIAASCCGSGSNNPTHYASLGGDYGVAVADVHRETSILNAYLSGYLPYFRVFIPPGTKRIDGVILEWQGQDAIIRYKTPPTLNFNGQTKSTNKIINCRFLKKEDVFLKGDPPEYSNGRLKILDYSTIEPLSVSRSGWFYVKMNSFQGSPSYYNSFYITVDTESYNNWYQHSGSNSDGSINWEKDVEGVENYGNNIENPEQECISTCGNGATCQTTKPDNITVSETGKCCDEKTCYQCPTGYYWNTIKCAPIQKNCDLTANLFATTSSGSSSVVKLKTNINSAFGPIYCDNQFCNGGIISNIDNCDFTCTYDNSGTFSPSVHVAGPSCAKDITTSVVVSNKDCAINTCEGNSCWNGTSFVAGTKTIDCATANATVDSETLATPGSVYISWTSSQSSKMEAACLSGPVNIARGGWYNNVSDCVSGGSCDSDKGYHFHFDTEQTGTEICSLYPYNADGSPGIPFSITINAINKNTDIQSQQTTQTRSSTYVCQPDNADCIKNTCIGEACFDGCNYLKGTKKCK